MIRSLGTKSSELGASQGVAGPWRPVAGFTWELFLIAFAWVISFLTIPLTLLWMKQGASPSTLFWIAFWGYFALTYKVTAWLSDRYRERRARGSLDLSLSLLFSVVTASLGRFRRKGDIAHSAQSQQKSIIPLNARTHVVNR